MACRPAFSSLTRTQGVLQAAAFGNCCSKTTHAGPTGPVWGFGGVVPLPGVQNRTQGHTEPSFFFCSKNEFTPPPKGGGAGYRLSWGRRVCPTRLQPAHTAPTGPVWGIAGVVSLRSFQNRTQGHTGPSLGSPFFLEAFLLRQGCQVLFQLVIRRLLDGADRLEQVPVPHQASLSFHLGGLGVDQSLLFQLSYVLGYGIGTHSCVLTYSTYARPALMRFPGLAENQVSIDRQLAGA